MYFCSADCKFPLEFQYRRNRVVVRDVWHSGETLRHGVETRTFGETAIINVVNRQTGSSRKIHELVSYRSMLQRFAESIENMVNQVVITDVTSAVARALDIFWSRSSSTASAGRTLKSPVRTIGYFLGLILSIRSTMSFRPFFSASRP